MTYKELLDRVSFDKVAPYLSKYHIERLLEYKLHFDTLRHMLPKQGAVVNGNHIHISYYNDASDDVKLLDASCLESCEWHEALAREIIVADSIDTTDEEIAATCLWHSSFGGFTEDDASSAQRVWHETFDKDLLRYYLRKYGLWIPSPKTMMAIKPLVRMKVRRALRYAHKRTNFHGNFCYTSRKRRAYKRWLTKDVFRSTVTSICNFVETIAGNKEIIVDRNAIYAICKCLFYATYVDICDITTVSGDASKRVAYLKEVYEEYGSINVLPLKNNICCVSYSSEYPLSSQEYKELKQILSKEMDNSLVVTKEDKSLATELHIDCAFYQ